MYAAIILAMVLALIDLPPGATVDPNGTVLLPPVPFTDMSSIDG